MTTLDTLPSLNLNFDHDGLSYREVPLKDLQAMKIADAVLLSAVQDNLKGQIDTTAEALRAKVVTPGAGQALEYQEVQAQATAALAASAGVTPALYPMLAATIGVDIDPDTHAVAADVLGVARSVKAAYEAWSTAGAAIRGARLKGKAAIDAATTIEAAAAAFDAIAWPALSA